MDMDIVVNHATIPQLMGFLVDCYAGVVVVVGLVVVACVAFVAFAAVLVGIGVANVVVLFPN